MPAFADSSRVIVNVQEDIFADKSELYDPKTKSLMTGFGGTRTNLVFNEDNQKPQVLLNKPYPITAFLKFDLNTIPTSTLFETVSIENSTLKLFFPKADDSDAILYVLTVSYCPNVDWNDKDMDWDTRPCKDNLEAIDTTVISENDIPGFVELDIVGAISKVMDKNNSQITLVLEAEPIQFDVDPDSSNIGKVTNFVEEIWDEFTLSDFRVNRDILSDTNFQGNVDKEYNKIWTDYYNAGFLKMKFLEVNFIDSNLQSFNYTVINPHILQIASSESEQLGHATSPSILVDYNIAPSVFNDSIIFTLTVVLPTLTIIVPVAMWMYKKSKENK